MNTEPSFARLAAKELAAEEIPPRATPTARRAQTLDAVREAIRMQARARRRRRVVVTSMAFAASVVLAVGAVSIVRHYDASMQASAPSARGTAPALAASIQGTLQLNHEGDARLASGNAVLVPGDRVVTVDEAPATLVLSSGTRLVLTRGSDLAVTESGTTQAFALGAGSVRADVAKQHAGERFLVRTVDTEVEVRGTSFVVESVPSDPLCGGGARTRVRVDEGIVSVRSLGVEVRVAAGEHWPMGCKAVAPAIAPSPAADDSRAAAPPPASPLSASPPSASIVHASPAIPPNAPASPAPIDEATRRSDLRAQNALFTDALAAKRRGDKAAALTAVNELLRRYPSGPLTENALVERMRLLTGTAALKAAREYLDRYPNGFARAEADGIAGP